MSFNIFPETVSDQDVQSLQTSANIARGDILTMTTLSASGHPGGSMSSIDILLTLYKFAGITPAKVAEGKADNVIVSIGHISPAVYTCLAANGFFKKEDAISQFRLGGSIYEGHIERTVPGVEWTTGNLGQGLSAGCGMALAAKVKGQDKFTYVLMGDGEQQKGQQEEAKRLAVKYNLKLIGIIDYNRVQLSGPINDIMPMNLEAEYKAAGWDVIIANGHDIKELVSAFRKAQTADKPAVIIAHTVMGKGVSFMENKSSYHGATLPEKDYLEAMKELGLTPDLDKYRTLRSEFKIDLSAHYLPDTNIELKKSEPKYYAADVKTDCRSAYGDALMRVVEANKDSDTPVVVFDCDLASSVKTADVAKKFPECFIEVGISEHNAATAAGAASVKGVIPFFSTFTMFAVDEVYNQLRMNDINETNLKVVATHSGIDVGEDGKTHQCIDYLGLLRNLQGFRVLTPADPNQTDHAIRYAAATTGNVFVGMGRSKVPVVTDEHGEPFFGEKYTFKYGHVDEIRKGLYPLLTYGIMVSRAIDVSDKLAGIANIGVYNVSTPVEPDVTAITKLAANGIIFVLEDHFSGTGLYSTVCQIVASKGLNCQVIPFGVPRYAYSGSVDKILNLIELDSTSVAEKIKLLLNKKI